MLKDEQENIESCPRKKDFDSLSENARSINSFDSKASKTNIRATRTRTKIRHHLFPRKEKKKS